jgi:coproporphyrinogen III oxidase-like Fe-S oxidoreductase
LSLYVHVPYCRVRCGYCDFNTYTAEDLGPGANREDYRRNLARELDLSVTTLAEVGAGRP